ncbi:MAG: trypsin-like peptidase domain-containing protein [Ktedonobacteraceae bacterium]|nr:trypsin-like peptidase domain-containing protein [Ktedonobacteraceae bacterium]
MLHPDVNSERTQPGTGPQQTPVDQQYVGANLPATGYAGQPAAGQPRRRAAGLFRTGVLLALTLVIALIFGVGLFAGWQFGRSGTALLPPPDSGQLQPGTNVQPTVPPLTGDNIDAVREAVIAKVKPAVVQINVQLRQGTGIGSGVIIDRRGYIVTNNHVVQGAQRVEVVLADGTRIPNAQVVGTDPQDDLAIIKINPPANMAVATLGDSSKLKVGQSVLAIGNPLGITQTVTSGIISALGRSVNEGQGGAVIPNAIQTDAPINPGNSGGALVDMQGNVIGIPTLTAIDPEFKTPASGVGFAIPSNRVSFIAQQIIQNGKVTHSGRAVLGVQVVDVDATVAAQQNLAVDHGAMIVGFSNNSPAARAGLQAGDVIVQVDKTAINDTQSLGDALVAKNPGDTVAVKVYRGNQQLTVNVTLAELQVG